MLKTGDIYQADDGKWMEVLHIWFDGHGFVSKEVVTSPKPDPLSDREILLLIADKLGVKLE